MADENRPYFAITQSLQQGFSLPPFRKLPPPSIYHCLTVTSQPFPALVIHYLPKSYSKPAPTPAKAFESTAALKQDPKEAQPRRGGPKLHCLSSCTTFARGPKRPYLSPLGSYIVIASPRALSEAFKIAQLTPFTLFCLQYTRFALSRVG